MKEKEHTFITGGAIEDDNDEVNSLKAEPEAQAKGPAHAPI